MASTRSKKLTPLVSEVLALHSEPVCKAPKLSGALTVSDSDVAQTAEQPELADDNSSSASESSNRDAEDA